MIYLWSDRFTRAYQIKRELGTRRFLIRLAYRLAQSMGWLTPYDANQRERKAKIDAEFDSKFGVSTGKIEHIYGLSIVGSNGCFGHSHIATEPDEFKKIISKLDIDFQLFTFIDLGSGKGRALMLASQFLFKSIIGVEFAKELHDSACINIGTLPEVDGKRITLVHDDVTQFVFPPEPLVIFLYNPFAGEVSRIVARKLFSDWRSDPRPIYIVYISPQYKDAWLSSSWTEIEKREDFSILMPQKNN